MVGGGARSRSDISWDGRNGYRDLQLHPHATLIGIGSSDDMLAIARQQLPSATFIASRLEDPLPEGPFDVVVSAFAIHHLDAEAKAVLFRRISQVLKERGRFAMLDVVPTEPDDRPLSLEEGIDKPSSVVEMLRWMSQAGLEGGDRLCSR